MGTGVLNRRCRPSSRSGYALYGHSAVTIVVDTWVENAHWRVVVGTRSLPRNAVSEVIGRVSYLNLYLWYLCF